MSTDTAAPAGKIQPRLKQKYKAEIQQKLQDEFGYKNVMQIPGLVKVVVNTGVGEAARDSKVIDGAVADLTKITGQKPIVTKARKSIAQFKLREGQAIGAHVTLRGDRAWEFVDRLVSLALPRIRDFRGLSPKQFDGPGNYTFGVTEQSIFHEIDQDRIDRVRGFDITVVTTAKNDDGGRALLEALGFTFMAAEPQAYFPTRPAGLHPEPEPTGKQNHPRTMSDPVADLLTRIRNANSAHHDTV